MKISPYFGLLLLGLLFVLSCDKENPLENDKLKDFVYPLSIGNTWIYEGTLSSEYYDNSQSSNNSYITLKDTIIIDSLYSEVDNIFRFKTIRFEERSDNSTKSFEGHQYISNKTNGLFHHGYESSGSLTLPRSTSTKKKYKINNVLFTHNELINFVLNRFSDITWEDEPLMSLKYPIQNNEQWTYRNVNNPWRMDRLVIEKTNEIFKVQTLYDIDEDSSWDVNMKVFHTYTFDKGLINYDVLIDSLMRTDEFGNELGLTKFQSNLYLIEHQIY